MKTTSALAAALRFGSTMDVLSVLESGVDPNDSGEFHISREDFEEKIELLIRHGWDINKCQLLHDAKHGLGKRVEFYLKKGVDPNLQDAKGQNA